MYRNAWPLLALATYRVFKQDLASQVRPVNGTVRPLPPIRQANSRRQRLVPPRRIVDSIQ